MDIAVTGQEGLARRWATPGNTEGGLWHGCTHYPPGLYLIWFLFCWLGKSCTVVPRRYAELHMLRRLHASCLSLLPTSPPGAWIASYSRAEAALVVSLPPHTLTDSNIPLKCVHTKRESNKRRTIYIFCAHFMFRITKVFVRGLH